MDEQDSITEHLAREGTVEGPLPRGKAGRMGRTLAEQTQKTWTCEEFGRVEWA